MASRASRAAAASLRTLQLQEPSATAVNAFVRIVAPTKPLPWCGASTGWRVPWQAAAHAAAVPRGQWCWRSPERALTGSTPAMGRTTHHAAKNAADAKRSKLFARICRDIAIAVKTGGGSDPAANSRLAAVVALAKKERVPKERIERALQPGGDGGGDRAYTIEATAAGGAAALIVETSIDPKQRGGIEASDLRKLLLKKAADVKDEGTLKFLFEEKFVVGVAEPSASAVGDPEELAIEVGAEDVTLHDGGFSLVCDKSADTQHAVLEALEARGVEYDEADVRFVPTNTFELTDADAASDLAALLDALSEHDSVVSITTNVDLPQGS